MGAGSGGPCWGGWWLGPGMFRRHHTVGNAELYTLKDPVLRCMNFTRCPPPPRDPRGHTTVPSSSKSRGQCYPSSPPPPPHLHSLRLPVAPSPPQGLGQPPNTALLFPQDSSCPGPSLLASADLPHRLPFEPCPSPQAPSPLPPWDVPAAPGPAPVGTRWGLGHEGR